MAVDEIIVVPIHGRAIGNRGRVVEGDVNDPIRPFTLSLVMEALGIQGGYGDAVRMTVLDTDVDNGRAMVRIRSIKGTNEIELQSVCDAIVARGKVANEIRTSLKAKRPISERGSLDIVDSRR